MSDAAGLLGLCVRSRKLASGDTIYKELSAHHVHLLILADDIGANAQKKLTDKCSYYKVPCVYMDAALMNQAIGERNRKAVAVLDKGFASALGTCLKG